MTTRNTLPTIAPCPRPGCQKVVGICCGGLVNGFRVLCVCGWHGPVANDERAAILAWNRRASDAEAERLWNQWSLLAGSWMRPRFGTHATANFLQAMSRERGEVLPAKTKKGNRT